jgi:central glycolytic genes regulator
LEDLQNIGLSIAVGGGMSKAEAISAFLQVAPINILVTDEGVARQLAE